MFLRRVFQGTFRTPQERLKVAFFFWFDPKNGEQFYIGETWTKRKRFGEKYSNFTQNYGSLSDTLKIYRKTSAKPNKLNFGEFLMQKKKEKKRQAQSFIANMF